MRIFGRAIMLLILSGLGSGIASADDALGDTLRQVIEKNYAAASHKSVDETMSTIDPKSPGYARTRKALPGQFDVGATTSLVSYRFVGQDADFAVARVKFKTTGKPGSSFVTNVIDSMTVFHQADGQWRLWDQVVLGVERP
jgi:hypothetical protein